MASVLVTDGSQPSPETISDKSVAWYKPDIGTIPEPAAKLLEQYSRIPPEKLEAHVSKVRDEAWRIAPYPCIGGWKFLELNMSLSPVYDEVLSRLKEDESLIDLGCCFGQDIRKLVHDGAPSEKLFGTDLNGGLIAAGFDLFLDRETLRSKFFVADICQPDGTDMAALEGQLNMVFAGSFFHLFDWDTQSAVAKTLVGILQARPNSMIFGHHLGNVHAGMYPYGLSPSGSIFKHDVASFQQLWKQVGEATGTHWRVEATLELMQPAGFDREGKWGDQDGRLMRFCVRRE